MQTLRAQRYDGLSKRGKGLMRSYVAKMTVLSRAQLTRLIGQFTRTAKSRSTCGRRPRFESRYVKADIELLAQVDEAHDTLSGPATQNILYREFYEFADLRYERISSISVAHIYNLRKRQFRLPHRPPVAEIGTGRKSPRAEICSGIPERRFCKSNRESGMAYGPH
jgi:hypothetical protein